MYKLVALDMDGTLLNSDGAISEHNKQAIAAARAQGVYVVLASGRPIEGMTWALKELNMNSDNDFVLSYNASLIQRVASQEVVRSQTLIGSDAKAIAAIAHDLGVHVHAFSRRQGLITPQHNYYTDHEAKINGLTITLADFAELDDNEEIMKVMIIDDAERLEAAIAQLPPALYQQYTIVRSAPFFLEFMHTNSNKGVGVKALADFLNINQDEVIAMGDAGNDHHMIEFAGLGVAMGNATEETKAIANYITDTNNNSGVAQVIEKFILNA
ncbi:Cof-type HAD-IIB family hydrolase [Photobacterium kishitanii]|uniref:sugar-phosphatase n=1 Tax=Photobacterium kishitanii TaxID=318456 RepID=UPI0005D3DABB|nr:sugar-phosphatase [Photobacterium kishitanii]KJG09791.1 HAD family hydrolase [Photobacterium kishitanii]PSV07695.1 Cof-type HAD-IIB family hydrolase [Photobacterium kishitanii]PSV76183.1 Cof-type HAD-IIB family hydrolase [Photobacterium kishitanii]